MKRSHVLAGSSFAKKLGYSFLVIIILVAIVLYWYANALVLTIVPLNVEECAKNITISRNTFIGEEWKLIYTHSVQKTPVEEIFVVQSANSFLLNKTRYQSYGVGLPFLASDGDLKILPEGVLELSLARVFPVVKIWTGTEAKVCVSFSDQEIAVYEIYPPGTLLEIRISKRYSSWFNLN